MVKNVLQSIGGIGLYGVISVCLFFTVFTAGVVWAFMHRKPFLDHMGALPLDDAEPTSTTTNGAKSHE